MTQIQSDTMHAPRHNAPATDLKTQQDTNMNSNSDGTWLLITSTMGLTLGYVRIDDHDHELSLSEIRGMIHDKLKDNSEYCHGFNFGTGWPLKIVNKNEEHTVLAQDVLPSVSVLSSHSAQHIVSTNNPISAATAMQYGMTPQSVLNMNFMGFPPTAGTANLQPLPISAIFTPIPGAPLDQLAHQIHKMPSSEQYYSPNTVALLQPQRPHAQGAHTRVKTESAHALQRQSAVPLLSGNSTTSNPADIPSLPPFSPPTLSQRDIEQKQKTQKEKLQNLLPMSKGAKKTEHRLKSAKHSDQNRNKNKHTSNRNKPKPVVLPRLKPMDADGHVIETVTTAAKTGPGSANHVHKKKKRISPPNKQAQKDLFCPECEKTFGNERGYRLHMTKQHQIKLARGRNKERRFRCDHDGCNRSFYQSSDLRRHQRVHLGVKPFKCSVCSKEFTQRGSLYRHIKSSHKGRDPKTLIILQTEETLPVSSNSNSNKPSTNSSAPKTDIPPPLMNSDNANNLPPEVNSNAFIGVPPPLISNTNTNTNTSANGNAKQDNDNK